MCIGECSEHEHGGGGWGWSFDVARFQGVGFVSFPEVIGFDSQASARSGRKSNTHEARR